MQLNVTAAYAKANLAELLKAVENGETVEITRYNKLVTKLSPATGSSEKPKLVRHRSEIGEDSRSELGGAADSGRDIVEIGSKVV